MLEREFVRRAGIDGDHRLVGERLQQIAILNPQEAQVL
jgi:hypothetical protein